MALRASADEAENVAAGFRLFRDPLPEYATDITSLIADLYAISSSLNRLDDLHKNRAYRQNLAVAHADVELVRTSLNYTFEDIIDFMGELDGVRGPPRDLYRRTWMDLCSFFRTQSHETLSSRLAKYKTFLNELEDYVRNKSPDLQLMATLRVGFKELQFHQEQQLAAQLAAVSLSSPSSASSNSADPGSPVSDRRPPKRRSYERTRPQTSPQSPLSPASGGFIDIPPTVPDAPSSPVTSSATSQTLSSTNTVAEHWAKRVFLDEHTTTLIPNDGECSTCLGEHLPGAKRMLHEQGFEKLVELSFNGDADFRVHFYIREDDHRARILCKSPRTSRGSEYYCLPLNMLEIVCVGSCLQLCRRSKGGKGLIVWANFKFTAIEQLVVFFCTFLALRSQDSGRPVERIRDYELEREQELFGGKIVDDNFLHALRIYRDTVSGAVRLQASVHKGEMKRSPIWTAFITQHIGTRGWMRLAEPKTVVLRTLQRSIFTFPDYNPPLTAQGEHILKFTNRSDATAFVQTISELAAFP
ncbi:hypothetical protein ATEIFO6365_0004068200 [Aspergillus terreus]|uniref:Uncharacterized protein n=1 Tax=Aspergillus terreus TaxID=33178 RepID=A0A5M3YUE3_ASPTE|nr:hypothetical protein ATETN484_0002070700 [Aspergillus terreus]GFF15563.1 hypothetical protein ATEIFO6365_0004068200 [Aspergillus terreus]